jgi:hypothetical protein
MQLLMSPEARTVKEVRQAPNPSFSPEKPAPRLSLARGRWFDLEKIRGRIREGMH